MFKTKKQLEERKSIPIGRTELDAWADRIIKIADVQANYDDQKFALCAMICELKPTEAFVEDGYFALKLRNAASKQTASMIMQEIREARAKSKKTGEETAPNPNLKAVDVLEDKTV